MERTDGKCQTITTADFHRMNSVDLLNLASIIRHRAETTSAVKFNYLSLREFINSIIHDFGYVDAELHFEFREAPPLPNPDVSFDGIGHTSKGYSMSSIRAIAYEEDAVDEG